MAVVEDRDRLLGVTGRLVVGLFAAEEAVVVADKKSTRGV